MPKTIIVFFMLLKQLFRHISLVFITLASTLAASASIEDENSTLNTEPEDWYQIEFVLFEHLQSDRHILRYQDILYALPRTEQYHYLVEEGRAISPFHLEQINNDEAVLSDAIGRLQANKTIRVYSTGGWKQAIKRDQILAPLKIAAGQQFGDGYQLEGELRVRRGRYIHIDINVFLADFKRLPYSNIEYWLLDNEEERLPLGWLAMPLAFQNQQLRDYGENHVPENVIQLKQTRRVKDGEIHYMDHPALGLITTVKKIDAPFAYGDGFFDSGISEQR